ncbi:hypothetical protein Micbo1qcDRAFT_174366 [Microdochium bolleyi]|uniref:Ribosomal protein L34-domain-containing protein n=1 Tax=Microdochium bolleyi TaxID=196109 RepID=A0A136J8A2_9PEZI|nr:hypothetical protein Micbo1qcDRAFT_174366 [Microdochium bolleyi]
MRSFTLAASSCRAALARASSASTSTPTSFAKRTFTSLPTLRPSLNSARPVFRSTTNTLARLPGSTPEASAAATAAGEPSGSVVADVVPRSSITSHPAFGLGFQIRCGPRPNLERSSRLVRKRRSGFLTRMRSQTGRKILQRRRTKKRSVLSY